MFFKVKPSLNPQGSKYIIENNEIVNFETGQIVSEEEISEKEISLDKIHQSFIDLSSNEDFLIENAGHVDLTEGQIPFQKTFDGDYCVYNFNFRKVDYRVLVNKKDNTVTVYSDRFGNIGKVAPKDYFHDFKQFSKWAKGQAKVWQNIYDVIYSDYYADKVKKADTLAIKLKSKLNVSIVFEFTDGEFVMISDSKTYYKDEVKVRPKNSNGKLKVFKNLKDFESKNSEKAQLIKQSMFVNESVLLEAFGKQVDVKNKVLSKFPQLKSFNVMEAFVMNGELYLTTEYDVDMSLFNKVEKFALTLVNESVAGNELTEKFQLFDNIGDTFAKNYKFVDAGEKEGFKLAGSITLRDNTNSAVYLFHIDSYDKKHLKDSGVKLKNGESVYRYISTSILNSGQGSRLVKINKKNGKMYNLTDEVVSGEVDTIEFESKGRVLDSMGLI